MCWVYFKQVLDLQKLAFKGMAVSKIAYKSVLNSLKIKAFTP
jgi:hypothetical protein